MCCSECGQKDIFQTEGSSSFGPGHEWYFGSTMNMNNFNAYTDRLSNTTSRNSHLENLKKIYLQNFFLEKNTGDNMKRTGYTSFNMSL